MLGSGISKRHVGQLLLFWNHINIQLLWNVWPQGINIAIEPLSISEMQITHFGHSRSFEF